MTINHLVRTCDYCLA